MPAVSWVNELERPPMVDVRRFGAKGDGTTDDTAAFVAAIASLPVATPSTGYSKFITFNPGGGIVFVPPGTYLVDTVVILSNVTLMGSGEGTIFKARTAGNSIVATSPNSQRCRIENLTIDCQNLANIVCLDLNSTMDGYFGWIKITGAQAGNLTGIGVWMRASSGNSSCTYNTLDHIHGEYCPARAMVHQGIDYVSGPVVTLNSFRHMRLGATSTPVLDLVGACDTNWFYDTDLVGPAANAIVFNSGNPGSANGVGAYQFNNTTFESIPGTCIVFANTSSNVFRGVRISGAPQSGSGTVNTNGTAVTYASGSNFTTAWVYGVPIIINGVQYVISSCSSTTSLTLATSAGVQTGVAYSIPPASLYSATANSYDCVITDCLSDSADRFVSPAYTGTYPFIIGATGFGIPKGDASNALTLSTGINSNVVVTCSFMFATGPGGAFNITGFTPTFPVFDGYDLVVFCNVSQTCTIKHDVTSNTGSRIWCTTGADISGTASGKSMWLFKYSSSIGYWVLMNRG